MFVKFKGCIIVIGVGKVVVFMVVVVEVYWDGLFFGFVVMCYVYGELIKYIEVVEVVYLVFDVVGCVVVGCMWELV